MTIVKNTHFENESLAVEASMRAWYRALEAHDWEIVTSGLTESFLMIEHDQILDKPSLLAMLKESAKRGRLRANLREFRTQIEGKCAWTTMHNDELWLPNQGEQRQFAFLETAVLRHGQGYWQIERYHATRLLPVSK